MARIRSIHPGFWTDEATLEMSLEAQLFMIGLWGEADDGGAFAWKPRQLQARIMPLRQVDISALLNELTELGVITRYEVDGVSYGAVRNFGKFQSPKKPNRKNPMPEDVVRFCATEETPPLGGNEGETGSSTTGRASPSADETTEEEPSPAPSTGQEKRSSTPVSHDSAPSSDQVTNQFPTRSEPVPLGRGGGRGEEEELLSHSVREARAPKEQPASSKPKTKSTKRGSRLPDDWQPSEELLDYANERNLNPQRITEDFRDYWHATPGAKACKLDWDATFRTWCRREADKRQGQFLKGGKANNAPTAPRRPSNPFEGLGDNFGNVVPDLTPEQKAAYSRFGGHA
ncbi:DnaT-like ssDNA-binding domain-containing protein [Saccharibacter floricola]|uniref:DnaT DNA-binding domain-containing protein n=1 Tax=Saccharibacter floricola DSM 15669 TaxID=1123227 RepID=A0ABQ0P158_9PROT|nr:DnaT-like ssDNA-binding domain-containing protein [Saccharibacter floricola]GBQ08458.1 hypothetical protein AA15669_1793 [Saccharibacter floricola DSM 15669]